jgi:hypothetical protein
VPNGYFIKIKTALADLAERFSLEMEVDKMIKSLDVPKDERGLFHVVITVVSYGIAYVE